MGVIDRLATIRSGKAVVPDKSPKYQEYLERIRWKGEIYCQACGSPLRRVPCDRKWYNLPSYNPMTGAKLTDTQRFGSTGLMVCEQYEAGRSAAPIFGAAVSFQDYFADLRVHDHGMYYVDKPPLE
jgi:hypothetical protein